NQYGWLEDKYCGATFHLIKFIRDGICKKWDTEHGKLPAPAPEPAPAPSPPPSTSPFPPSSQQPPKPAPAPAPVPASNDNSRQEPAPSPSTESGNTASTDKNANSMKANTALPDGLSPSPSSPSSSSSGMPFPSSGNANQSGQTGSMTAVYIGVGVAAAIVVALFIFLGIRVARNRRRRQEEAMAAYAIHNGAQRDMPPPNLVPSPPSVAYMREADIEAGNVAPASPTGSAPPAMMPIYETRNVAPAPLNDPFIFDATANMAAAGLDQFNNNNNNHSNGNGPAPVPQPSNAYNSYANDPILASYTNPNYGQNDAIVSPGAGVAIATSTGVAVDDYHPVEVPDDVFGEHIYGDTTMTNNVVHSADLSPTSPTTLNDAGYCLDSLRADSYMNQPHLQHAIHEDNQLNVGTYGSDAVYLDATEEFPHVPAISPDDARLKTP
ncbi:hypothetical protein BDF22DRAFT_688836, partial [Syncephalis plumigaleata]